MILLHLFFSAVPRSMDTPRMRTVGRAACVVLLVIVCAGAMLRGADEHDEAPADVANSQASPGRGNVSIIHLPNDSGQVPAATPASDAVTSGDPAETPAEHAPAPATEHAVDSAHAVSADSPAVAAGVPGAHPEQPASADSPVAIHDAAAVSGAAGERTAHHEPAAAASGHAEPVAHGVDATQGHAQAVAHAAQVPPGSHGTPAHAASRSGRPEPVDDFAESGRRFWLAGDHAAAERSFMRALTENVPVERKRDLVLEMAGLYRSAGQLPRAAATLEKFLKTYPSDRDVPRILLQLGGIYRELGVYSMATARFFQVLNSTLRVSDEDLPEYRKLATKARLEIAETYAIQGNLTEAERYFSRLQLLELEPEDRERVVLRGAQMQFTLGQWLAVERALAAFTTASPESPRLAEVRYMRAKSLEQLGRKQEAIDEVVALLQMPVVGDEDATRSTAYWKRRCANELANNFYEQGDFLGALSVYQALARASMDPNWRWPAVYQIGLCFERLNMPQRAAEAYDALLVPETAPAPGVRLPEALASLQEMARWRRSHLVWIEQKAQQLDTLAAD